MVGKMHRVLLGIVIVMSSVGVSQTAHATDNELPVIVPGSGSLSPLAVARNQTLTFSFRITDDVGCCSAITFDLYGAPGRNVNTNNSLPSLAYVTNPNSTRTSGTAIDGRYETTLTIPSNFPFGTYFLKVQAIDLAGGYTHLEQIGSFEVGEDLELPVLVPGSGQLIDDSLNAGDQLDVSFRITDTYGCCRWAGIGIYTASGRNVNSGEILWRSDQLVTRIDGTESDGRYTYSVQIPNSTSPGTYYVKAQANDFASWHTHLEPVGTLTVFAPVVSVTPNQSVSRSSPGLIESSLPSTSKSPSMSLRQKLTAKSLATQIGMTVSTKAKIKLTVAKSSKKICKVSVGRLIALKPGNCSVTVSVTPAKTKAVKKPKTTKQSTVVAIS